VSSCTALRPAQSQLILILCLDRGRGLHKDILSPLGHVSKSVIFANTVKRAPYLSSAGTLDQFECTGVSTIGDLKLTHQMSSFFRSEGLIGLFPSLDRIWLD
jgi:hypothetical protein